MELLFGAYRRRILSLLLLHPEQSFYVREIGRLTGVPAGSLHREVSQLSEAGLLNRSAAGNQVRYQVNRFDPIYGELAGIFLKTAARIVKPKVRLGNSARPPVADSHGGVSAPTLHAPTAPYVARRQGGELKIPRESLAALCRKYGVKKLSLFGSAARGELGPDSDVDVLVEFDADSKTSFFDLPAMQDELSELLGNRKVDIATNEILNNPFRRKAILPELKTVYAA